MPRPLGSQPRQDRIDRLLRSMVPRLNRPPHPHRLPFLAPRSRWPIDHPARCRRRDRPLRLACRNVAANQHMPLTARRTVPRSLEHRDGFHPTPIRHKFPVHNLPAKIGGHLHELPGFPVPSGHLGTILRRSPRSPLVPEGIPPDWRWPKGTALHVRRWRSDRHGSHTNGRGRNPAVDHSLPAILNVKPALLWRILNEVSRPRFTQSTA